MKHLIYVLFIAMLVGCEMLSTDNDSNDNGNNEENPKLTLYQITEDIDAFESVFLAEDGNCLAIKKDTTFGYVAVIDSLKADDEKALVVYIDSLGKVRRVFNDGKSLDIAYNSEGYINLWYRDSEGTSEIFNDIKYTPTKTVTKAGEVFNPMDIGSIALALLDMKDIKDAMAFNPLIGDGLKANIMADLLTTGPFSNTTTEILTGITSIAITAIVGTSSLPIAVLLAIIGTADAAISDWQNMVADSYFGTAHPVTGEAVQLTDKHFVVSYSIADVDSGNTDFKVGVIVAEGKIFEDAMFITKNWHSYKKSEIYASNNGHIIINLGDLNPKKGDKLKYRIYLEPADDNGFKWDDKLLDYWRYGEVKEFVIDEPALKIESAVQTNATTDDGYRYTFDVDVNVRNDIPFELDDWGVAIYTTSLDVCTSEDQQYDIKSAKGNGSQTMSFSIDINDVMMDTEQTPSVPIMNHFAVPYISFDGHTYGIYNNAVKINLAYDVTPTFEQWVDLGLPSGILWAGWNVGANKPDEYGGHFAWGETEEKSVYLFSTYKHRERKYYDHNHTGDNCECWRYKYIGDCISGTQYDVATIRWGGGSRMPTNAEFKELEQYCTCINIENNSKFKTNGSLVIGPNGNSIFLPYGGWYGTPYESNPNPNKSLHYQGTNGCYWSGDCLDLGNAYGYRWGYSPMIVDRNKFVGCSVRAVKEK